MINYKPIGAYLFNYKGANEVYTIDMQSVLCRLQLTELVNPNSKGLQVIFMKQT